MKTVKEIIDGQLNYGLSSILVDYILDKKLIANMKAKSIKDKLNKKYAPASRMLEGLDERNN
ncbi:hypothetical protein [Ligilactobacillus ceti]|uniref:hypothetical protein n=1 Tax=Ligilactobacillus ceti TaxID=395085 RepID=UPI0004284512|nr:hypothetical protein [Ligilactobacillus ceti]